MNITIAMTMMKIAAVEAGDDFSGGGRTCDAVVGGIVHGCDEVGIVIWRMVDSRFLTLSVTKLLISSDTRWEQDVVLALNVS
jgi:hypothetical protein